MSSTLPSISTGDDPWTNYTAPPAPPQDQIPTTKPHFNHPEPERPDSPPFVYPSSSSTTAEPSMSEAEAINTVARLCATGPLSAVQEFFATASAEPPTGTGISAFALANEPHPTTGLVPLHYAAKEGRIDIVRWLVTEAGAIVDLEDREGETALHKAALTGRLPVCTFLLVNDASPEAPDSDGWTPLHNACSRGYLDIVRLLVEQAEASVNTATEPRGWTPLMNAASKGHLPIVRYLTARHHADPFIRNSAGETAYDVAASTFEVYICEVLEKYEAERWNALKYVEPANSNNNNNTTNSSTRRLRDIGNYNPLALHNMVPVIIYENQRLDTRLSTLAIHGGRPRWSSSSAARRTAYAPRAPYSLPPGPLSRSKTRHLAVAKDDVLLPLRDQPYKMRFHTIADARAAAAAAAAASAGGQAGAGAGGAPGSADLSRTPTNAADLHSLHAAAAQQGPIEASEPSHFWLSDWQIDFSHPMVSVDEDDVRREEHQAGGWQYAEAFDTPEPRWSASQPPPLKRLLEGKGLSSSVTRAITAAAGSGALPIIGSSSHSNNNSNGSGDNADGTGGSDDREATPPGVGWVRRRRWVRVMRRRLDIEFGDELEAAERIIVSSAAASGSDGFSSLELSPAALRAQDIARSEAARLVGADYVARAKTLAGQAGGGAGITPADVMGETRDETDARTARLELAVGELRANAFSDGNSERRARAEELLKEYMVQLGQLRQATGADEDDDDEDSDIDPDEEFIYPNSYKDEAASVITRIAPTGSGGGLLTPTALRPAILDRVASSASVFGPNVTPSEAGTSAAALRSADLAASREFRVPTHDAPNRHVREVNRAPVLREQVLTPQWENDADAAECRGCSRRFTFFLRKHHCRRCGRIFCDACSTHRAHLSPQELVVDPAIPEMYLHEAVSAARICNSCNAERQLPPSLRSRWGGAGAGANSAGGAAEALLRNGNYAGGNAARSGTIDLNGGIGARGGYEVDVDGERLGPPSDVSSRASELNECPVCDTALASLGDSAAQEAHVRSCLENGGGGSLQGGRYLVYKLPEGSPIVNKECVICMEDFVVGAAIARLPCLCYFHRACIDSWFKKGRACPVHARTW